MKTLSEIALPAWLPNLYINKYSNLLQPVRVMIFLYATTISLIKLIFYIKNKETVHLKLQDRIRRSNSFIRNLSLDNEAIFVRYYLSSRPEVFCKKAVLKKFFKIHRKTPVLKCLFNKIVGLRPAALLKRDSSKGVFREFSEIF